MRFIDAMPATEAVTGNLMPIVIPHLVNLELPDYARTALMNAFDSILNAYVHSGAFNSRSAALRKSLASRDGFREVLSGRRSVQRLIYKEPFLAFAPEYTYDSLPSARFIYILRDGRDVADSLVRTYGVLTDEALVNYKRSTEAPIVRTVGDRVVPWWVAEGRDDEFLASSQYVRAIWMWTEMVRRCRTFLASERVSSEGRVLQIRYEELVTDPDRWGAKINAHLGVEMTSRMRQRISAAQPSSIGKHRRRSSAEIEDAMRVAGDELRANGYFEDAALPAATAV